MRWGKLRLIFLLLLAVNCSLPLFSVGAEQAFKVAIISLDSSIQAFASLVQARASIFGSTLHIQQSVRKELELQYDRKLALSKESELSKAYASYDEQLASSLVKEPFSDANLEQPKDNGELETVYSVVDYQDSKAKAFHLSDDALTWFAAANSYDAMILVSSQDMGGVQRVRLVWFLPLQQIRIPLLDKVVVADDYRVLQSDVDKAIFKFASNTEVAALQIENAPPGLETEVDGILMQGPVLFLKEGIHQIVFVAPNHDDKTLEITLVNGNITITAADMTLRANPPIFLYSGSGSATWFSDGIPSGTGSLLSIEKPTFPLLISLVKEGFSTKVVQLSQSKKSEVIAMQPLPLSSSSILQKGQRDFYKQLRNTILMFGISIGISALSNTYAVGSTFWQPALIATSSLTLVCSLAAINELASYAALAQ